MEMNSNQNGEEVVIEDGALETRDGSLWAKMKWFWLRRTGLERALLLLVFLLLLSLIAVIAVLVIDNRQSYPASNGGMEICMNDTCITAAADMISSMDLLADPCVDFYQYACGNWLRNNPIPKNGNAMTVPYKTSADVLAYCNNFLKEKTTTSDSNDVLWKTKTFFRSCLNEELIEHDGAAPLLGFLDEFGGFDTEETPSSEKEDETDEDITTTFYNLYLVGGSPTIIWIIVTNEDIRIANPHYQQLFNQTEMEQEREFIKETLSVLYPNGSREVISRLAVEFTNIHETLINCSSSNDMGNLTTLQTLVPKINWGAVIRSLSPEKSQTYPVRLYDVNYFRVLGHLFDTTSKRLIKQYMMWRTIKWLLPHASEKIRDISAKYQSQAVTSDQDRDIFCTKQVIEFLEDAIASLFIERKFDAEELKLPRSTFEQIKQSFKELVEIDEDLDSNSKFTILEKIDKIVVEVASPVYIHNHTLVNEVYKMLQIGDQYLTNLIAARKYSNLLQWSAVSGIIEKGTSAAYTPYTVIIPLLTLLRPNLSLSKLSALTFSGYGNSMAHEISHSVDMKHSAEWADLTGKGREVFKGKMECLQTALEKNMETEYANQNLTISNFMNEFWSDVSGLEITYQAFKKSEREHFRLPYLNITSDQIFYLNFAQTMCGHWKESLYLSPGNRYPPPKYRVLGTLRNSHTFSAAFNCPRGSPMNPLMEKCEIWQQVPN